jgi:hypothetical protein
MDVLDLLKGKKVEIMTDAKVAVELEIKSVTENRNTTTIQLEPDTPENDWWGRSESHTTITYIVEFVNGYKKTYSSINSIKIIE